MLANSDYAFLEPTLGEHTKSTGLATSPDAIGMLFSVSSITYTLSCPLIGILANRERVGPRPIIVGGLLFPLVLFGVGESMSMTPVMDDMMHSVESRGDSSDAAVNSLSSLLASSFSLGQMVGPMIGSAL